MQADGGTQSLFEGEMIVQNTVEKRVERQVGFIVASAVTWDVLNSGRLHSGPA